MDSVTGSQIVKEVCCRESDGGEAMPGDSETLLVDPPEECVCIGLPRTFDT